MNQNKSIVATVNKEWGKMKLGKLGQKNIDHFVALLSLFQKAQMETGELPQELTIPFSSVRELALVERDGQLEVAEVHRKEFMTAMKKLGKDLASIYSEYTDGEDYELTNLFSKYKVEGSTDTIKVRWNKDALPLVEHLTKNALLVKKDFYYLKSGYAKVLYMWLKEFDNLKTYSYKETGKAMLKISVEDFSNRLDLPKSYNNSNIWLKVINPCVKELEPFFANLECKSYQHMRKTVGYIFTWTPAEAVVLSQKQKNAIEMKAEGIEPKKKKAPQSFEGEREYDYEALEKALLEMD